MHHVTKSRVYQGDCLHVLKRLASDSVDLAYLDPPFLTQKSHRLTSKQGDRSFSFGDLWTSHNEYAEFLHSRLIEIHRVLAEKGSIYFHCDRNATHIVRALLDKVFGPKMFRSEIIWHYRRWSNTRKGLLPSHQTIYYYTKSDEYKFNTNWQEYSPSTNVDQILQQRSRDGHGKSAYKKDSSGKVLTIGDKKGVPLGDVWDIPYLNPKATERTGYPTQKPVVLLERIISLSSNVGDLVLDPFCGSGSTIVAAKLLGRNAIGIDVSEDAVELTRRRIQNPVKTESALLANGREAYRKSDDSLLSLLRGVKYAPVQRNSGIDAILQEGINRTPVPVRVQREHETILEAAYKLYNASKDKGADVMFLVAISEVGYFEFNDDLPQGVVVIDSPGLSISKFLTGLREAH